MSEDAELVVLFKALADASRLKIIGLLAQQPYSVEQLAAMLGLNASTISHHLSRLAGAGLVSAKAEGYYSIYQLENEPFENITRRLFSNEQIAAVTADVDMLAFENKVVKNFSTPDGRLTSIPAQRKKLEIILRHIVKCFVPGQRYSEKQVNDMLARFHPDTATLRRELVGSGLMQREDGGGEYWRVI